MPWGHIAVLGGILTHWRYNDAVMQSETSELERGEEAAFGLDIVGCSGDGILEWSEEGDVFCSDVDDDLGLAVYFCGRHCVLFFREDDRMNGY